MRNAQPWLLIVCLAGVAHAEPTARPREKFGDAERAFRDAKAMLLREHVDDSVTEEDLYRAAVAGMMTAAGRKWDTLLSPSELGDLHGDLAGEIVGVGLEINVDAEHGFLSVLGTFPGSPAEKAGLAAGDRVMKVDGRSVRGPDAMDVVRSIRGKAGTSVTLSILRDAEVLTKTLKRTQIVVNTVSDLTLPDGVALVWLRVFNDKTPALLRATLQRIAAQKPRALVIDLRGNQGGLFDKMIECAGLLLPRGSLIATQVERGKREQAVRTNADPVVKGVQVALLVDGSTGSGGEILAGALRDGLGARLVGSRTLGKWNVQKIMDLPNGYAIKYTVGVFKTAKGQLPDGKGLEPEVPVDLDEKTVARVQREREPAARIAADPQLRAALALVR